MAQTCKRQLYPVYSALPKLCIIFKSINLIQIQPPLTIDKLIYLIDKKLFDLTKKGAGEASLTFSPRTDLEGLMEAKTWCTARRPDLQEGAWTGVRLLGEENS